MDKEKIIEILNKYSADVGGKVLMEPWFGNVVDDIVKLSTSSKNITCEFGQVLPRRLSNSAYIRATSGNYESFMEWWDKQN